MAKKQKCPEFENHERWLVSFADMMTLLFAVFVVLYALKDDGAKDSELEQAAASIQEAFNEVMEEIPDSRRVGPLGSGFQEFEDMNKKDKESTPDLEMEPTKESRIIDRDMKKVTKLIDMRLYGSEKFRPLQAKGQARIVTVHRDRDGFRVRILASHFFNSGSYRIRSQEALDALAEVAEVVKEVNRPVTIEGHTDSIPFEGEGGNWGLSSMRATSVLRYFIRNSRFDKTKLSSAGYGDTRPIASNATAESRNLNRRIEIKVHYD